MDCGGPGGGFINHFYFYLWDSVWGAAFWKTNAYAPFPIWLWLNGHEWAKSQLDKARIGYEALDNGFHSCRDAVCSFGLRQAKRRSGGNNRRSLLSLLFAECSPKLV